MNNIPFDDTVIKKLVKEFGTPVYLYDENGMLETSRKLNDMFSWIAGYRNYFASKALPNPYIHKILKEKAGMGVDVSSMAELILAQKTGFKDMDIMFSSNDTSWQDFQKVTELGGIINFDDIRLIDYYEQKVGPLPDLVCFRYNPGDGRLSGGNDIIGNPADAKYGLTYEQIFEAYKIAKQKGATRFGLHSMMVSSEIRIEAHEETAKILFELAAKIEDEVGIEFEFINLGGGLGIPYNPGELPINTELLSKHYKAQYELVFNDRVNKPTVVSEHGRYVTGPHGYLVLTVRHLKETYKDFIGTDGSMANLMRPGMYGAHHWISVLGKEELPKDHVYDVVGSLCENNDKFAIDRSLPKIEVDDILIIGNAGAHAHAMGFNYNGKLRSAEVLLRENGELEQIRRAETIEDYFATLDFSKLK